MKMMIPKSTNSLDGKYDATMLKCKDRNWSDDELYKLSAFMRYNINKFKTQKIRKQSRIYAILSRYLETRNVNQCRTYVQKLFIKFRNYQNIINFFEQSLPLFYQKYEKQEKIIEKIIFPLKTISKQLKQLHKLSQIAQKNQLNLYQYQCQRKENINIKMEDQIDNKQQKATDVIYSDELQNKEIQLKDLSLKAAQSQKKSLTQRKSIFSEYDFEDSCLEQKCGSKDEQWRQCHQIYLQWTSKTLGLLQKYQNLSYFQPFLY